MAKKLTLKTGAALLAVALVAVGTSFAAGRGGTQQVGDEAPQSRKDIVINDENPSSENLTSSKDGTVFFGSMSKGTIYRAAPNAAQAEPWIKGDAVGMVSVTGLLADDKSNTLWVCSNPPFGRDVGAGQMALRTFDLKTGAPKGTYSITGGGVLNDIALAKDGTAYVSESFGGRILRLKPRAKEVDVWISDPVLRGVDGLSFLADGALYVNNFFNGKFSRIVVGKDGAAGPVVEIKISLPFSRPDGLRTSDRNTLLQAESQGRLTEISIDGDKAEVRVIREGLGGAAGVTQIGVSTYVLTERRKAVAVPMPSK